MRHLIIGTTVIAMISGCNVGEEGDPSGGGGGKADGFFECEGANPAGCFEDDECGDGMVCDLDECVSSGCDCMDGTWVCTPDCSAGLCVPENEIACEGPNPEGCMDDDDCGEGMACDLMLDACTPSSCECDETTGIWVCTPDCSAGLCVPESETACEGPNPEGCTDDYDCGDGMACDLMPDACLSSGCACDESAGSWVCLPDCGGGLCVPEAVSECEGPNPAGCFEDDECGDGMVCDLDVCASSGCDCMDGTWVCTPDCSAGLCVHEETTDCEGPNPAGCFEDEECGDGMVCDLDECASSGCDCMDGWWVCTPDCMAGLCVPEATTACEGPNPAGCIDDTECGGDMVCYWSPETCLSSGCGCDESSGAWNCLPDCGGGICIAE